jgi:hypothetical protein
MSTEEAGFEQDGPGLFPELDQRPPRPGLDALLRRRAWVEVTNPVNGSSWTGRLIAYHEDPGVVIEPPSHVRLCLPAAFTITEVAEPVTDDTGESEVWTAARDRITEVNEAIRGERARIRQLANKVRASYLHPTHLNSLGEHERASFADLLGPEDPQ